MQSNDKETQNNHKTMQNGTVETQNYFKDMQNDISHTITKKRHHIWQTQSSLIYQNQNKRDFLQSGTQQVA